MEKFSRDVACFKHFNYFPEVPTVKHAHIICYMLEFSSTYSLYIQLRIGIEYKRQNFGVYLIDVKNTHECFMNFENIHISLTRLRYWYEIRGILVPILHTR